jgi:hypothetical protein
MDSSMPGTLLICVWLCKHVRDMQDSGEFADEAPATGPLQLQG